MTEEEQKFKRWLFIGAPIFLFLIVLLALLFLLRVPLVLAVVLACLFAVINFAILNWLLRQDPDGS